MFTKIYPQKYISSIWNIKPESLREKGIKGIIIDLDNTLIPWKSKVMPNQVAEWFNNIKKAGIAVCVVSNARSKRVNHLIKPFDIPAISKAVKPRRKAFIKAMELMSTTILETAVIGDQLFTDILGGNRLGLYTILVVPMSKKEFIGTKMVRQVEKVILKRGRKRNIINKT